MKFSLEDIEAVKDNKLIHVTTRGRKTGRPHTVELWFALADGKLYLSHEGERTDWMKNIAKEEAVAVNINKLKFEARGKIVGEGSSRERGKRALYEKYYGPASKKVIDDWFELSTVIELTPLQPV